MIDDAELEMLDIEDEFEEDIDASDEESPV